MKSPALWSVAAAVMIAAVIVEGSLIRRQRRAAAAALAAEKSVPPEPAIVSAPEIQVTAPPAPRVRPARVANADADPGGRYAALIRSLGHTVPAAQLANLRDLLDAKEHVAGDALDAAREAGVDPGMAGPEIQRAVAQERAAIDDRIKAEVGIPAWRAVQQFELEHPEQDLPPAPPPGAEGTPPPPPAAIRA